MDNTHTCVYTFQHQLKNTLVMSIKEIFIMKRMVSIFLSLFLSVSALAVNTEEYIKANEGLRLTPYVDSHGFVSIGYGRNLEGRGITKSMAEYMLAEDILECRVKLFKHYPWYVLKSSNTRVVLVDMCYNLGFNGLSKFKKMLKALYEDKYYKAVEELLDSKYALHLPARAKRNADLLEDRQ